MMIYCRLDSKEHISVKFGSKYNLFLQNAFENNISQISASLLRPKYVNDGYLRIYEVKYVVAGSPGPETIIQGQLVGHVEWFPDLDVCRGWDDPAHVHTWK